jgi:hypothetical protein
MGQRQAPGTDRTTVRATIGRTGLGWDFRAFSASGREGAPAPRAATGAEAGTVNRRLPHLPHGRSRRDPKALPASRAAPGDRRCDRPTARARAAG